MRAPREAGMGVRRGCLNASPPSEHPGARLSFLAQSLKRQPNHALLGYMPFVLGAAARFFLIFPQNEAHEDASLTGLFLFY
jgi:hypothetical protein